MTQNEYAPQRSCRKSGVAVQLYHCSRVLILTNSPCLGGMAEYQKQRKELDQHIGSICGIAVHLKGDPESVMCSQALFICKASHK